ncbi:MAG: nucleoside recognition protein [Lachnospiraceae bacterium]|nr:nucleoside recognition protein [Lachnospiraceae bacterium]
MINYLWGIMIVIGVVYGALTGKMSSISTATINSAKEAVTLCITMLGVMSLWMGLMSVARSVGLMDKLTRVLRPVIRILFPDLPKDHIVNEYIASNMIANILGLGWAATPVGLKAMKELAQLNNHSDRASCDMCTFLIINISSLQLIPVNIIAYRSQYGSVNPAEILGAGLLATTISTIVGVVFSVVARKTFKK